MLLIILHPEISNKVPEKVIAFENLSISNSDSDRDAIYSSLAFLYIDISISFDFSLNSEPVGFMASGLLILSGSLLFSVVDERFSLFALLLSALILFASSNKLVNILLITWKDWPVYFSLRIFTIIGGRVYILRGVLISVSFSFLFLLRFLFGEAYRLRIAFFLFLSIVTYISFSI